MIRDVEYVIRFEFGLFSNVQPRDDVILQRRPHSRIVPQSRLAIPTQGHIFDGDSCWANMNSVSSITIDSTRSKNGYFNYCIFIELYQQVNIYFR